MAPSSINYISALLLISGLLGILYLLLTDRITRRSNLYKVAKELNGTFFPGPIYDYDGYDKWYELNVIEWKNNELPYQFYDYVKNSNLAYSKYLQSFIKLELPNKFPAFKLLKYPDSFLSEMETDKEFKACYSLYTHDVNKIVDLFNVDVRQYFIDYPFYNIECDGYSLSCFKTRQVVPESEIPAMAQWLENTFHMLQQSHAAG
jgi:hypothetical protein